MGQEPRVHLDLEDRSKNFLVDTELLCPDHLFQGFLLPKLYHFGWYRKNNYKKIHLSTLLLGWTNIFPPVSGGPLVSYSLIVMRYFPALQLFQS